MTSSSSLLLRAAAVVAAVGLAGCVATQPAGPRTLTVLSINDFHGYLQSRGPTPAMLRLPEADGSLGRPQAAGGIPYLASALDELRAQHPDALVVAAGDLIGASPLNSALLDDEPSLAAFDKLGLVASALGNHELDMGLPALQDKLAGRCPATGCPLPGYSGVHFPYLAANLIDSSGKTPFQSYVIREVQGLKLAVVGVVTKDTPKVSLPRNMEGLRFLDEADTLNALVPELRAQGVQLLVAVMHEGAEWRGPANDPSYACAGLGGRGVDIAHRLAKDYAMIVSGHSHMAYTCKVDGRLLVQAGSFGAWVTQTTLQVDGQGHVLDAQAVNVPVLQSLYTPAPAFAALEAEAEKLTESVRLRPIATVAHGLRRTPTDPDGDAGLGNLIADSQAAYARAHDTVKGAGPVVALMNLGGIRTDLEASPARPVNLSELTAIQPFHNELVALTLSGAQLRELLTHQLPRGTSAPRLLQPSSSLRYSWARAADGSSRLVEVQVDGQPLDDARSYRIVANGFMADGGEGLSVMRQGRDRTVLGVDLDALLDYLPAHPEAVDQVQPGRIRRVE
ncbi:bifunctional UDP-sugar hydrolase/5'-nucleotidase [Pelomonas sp. KK5]|uniref:bifunctional metallophosphatase/5'-nucleotidase n=1 Tax=Pelomonas sp. KK5 TaxID=1855730 RepID=UPI00097BFDFC|nr:bifunctional metallophosphatase/5'-nucleotidase [Pelomonas sp. KK5]